MIVARLISRSLMTWSLAAGLLGCGAASVRPTSGDSIDAVRQRAAAAPADATAQTRWAEAELLMSGGDPNAATSAVTRARALSPDDARVSFLQAFERHVHGDADAAVEGYLRTIELAHAADDAWAPALAEVSLAYLLEFDDGVPGFQAQILSRLAPFHADPGHLGPQARHVLGATLTELAYRRGDLAEVQRLSAAQGCAAELNVAGPFGPRQLLGFDEALAPEAPGPLAARYDLGPGRGERATRTLQPRGCTLHQGNGPVGGAGITYGEATFSVPAEGDYVVRLESPNTVELFVDDASITRVDRRREVVGRVTFHPVHLSGGAHRLMVKTASRHPNPVLILSLLRPDGRPASEGPAAGGAFEERAVDDGSSPLGLALSAARAAARADFVAARTLLSAVRADPQATGPMLSLAGLVTLSDSLLGEQTAADEARRVLTRAAERDPEAWYPRLQLAALESDELTAITLLRDASAHWPEIVLFPLRLVDALEAKGWSAQADAAVESARAAVPDACRPRRAAMNSALRRAREAEVGRLAEELVACDARSDARLQHMVRGRAWDAALVETRRIAALEPASARATRLDAELTLARGRGDDAQVGTLLTELASHMPRSETVVEMQADRALAAGDAQGFQAVLDEALTREPASMAELRRVQRALGGDDPLGAYRQDGADVIRAFEASGRVYDGPKALVLDSTVVRVFDDGSSLELTHNIIRVQSEEAVDQEGEYSPPDGAQLLTLRTVKADGRRLEPDEIQGKDTISMPNLAVGDYVEFEYLRAEPPAAGFPRGALGDRFYFQSFEVPFDRSELTLIVPSSVHPIIDPRGAAPATEERVDGALRVLRWRVQESRPRTIEPGSVSAREFLPSVLWGWNASWEGYVESLRDVLADRELRDPEHEVLARRLAGESGATVEQRARRIYHWVLENIEDADEPFGQAATMVHSRTGNRARVLAYLLHLANIDAEIALARSFGSDRVVGALADEETFAFLCVRMHGSAGPLWLWPGTRGAPFGFLPLEPAIRGQEALILDATAERTHVGDAPSEGDSVHAEADVHLDGEGGAHVEVVERFEGANAVAWRAQLESVPPAQLEDVFSRQYIAQIVPGARMSSLEIGGRNDPEQPLTLHYEFDVRRLGRLEESAQLVGPLYPIHLANNFAPLARRSTTQIVPGGARDILVRLHLPQGAAAPSLPEAHEELGPHGFRASWSARSDAGIITIERSLRMGRARIEPEQYEDFARFCRHWDEVESRELRISL